MSVARALTKKAVSPPAIDNRHDWHDSRWTRDDCDVTARSHGLVTLE
jgi:hypothetical protein